VEPPRVGHPSAEALRKVKAFAALTGDIGFLSAADLEVIALTYMLHMERDGSPLRDSPVAPKIEKGNIRCSWAPKDLETVDTTQPTDTGGGNEVDTDDDEGYTSDGDDWVTQENLHRMGVDVCPGDGIRVACITGDFSIQNVLLQMGLYVLSTDYHRIRTLKLWGLICRGCRTFSRDTTKLFCQKCGHATVDRVPITIEPDGSVVLHDNRRRINNRGTVYDMPKPKGGRFNKDMIFSEDQLMMGGRDREYRHQLRTWEKEKQRRDPFNPDVPYAQEGWWSRATMGSGRQAVMGPPKVQVGFGRGNPNSNRWRKSRGKGS